MVQGPYVTSMGWNIRRIGSVYSINATKDLLELKHYKYLLKLKLHRSVNYFHVQLGIAVTFF